jgi:MFS family permease
LFLILETVGITSVTQQTLLNGFLNLWNLIVAVAAALLVDRVGRKKLFLCSTSIMLVAYIVITALSATFAKDNVKSVGTAVSTYKSLYFSELIRLTGHSILIHLLRWLRYRLCSSSNLLSG